MPAVRCSGLLYIDLDRVKTINDRYGRSAGDDFIKRASIALLQSYRDSDIVGRIGGDEFVIVGSPSQSMNAG